MDNEECKAFIELYRRERVLWDPKHKRYYMRAAREEAWRRISERKGVAAAELQQKMKSLLGSYRREKSRRRKSKQAGTVYVSRWFAYPLFNFLDDRQSSNDEINESKEDDAKDMFEHSNFEYEDFELPNDDENFVEEKPVIGKKRRFEYEEEPEQDLLNVAEQPLQESVPLEKSNHQPARKQDELSLYGQLLVTKLRKFDHQTRLVVCNKIDNLIFEMEMKSMKSKEQACQDPLLNDVPSTSRINYNKTPNSTPSHSEMSDH
ncbi:unnamed protein product [Phyllotreta striolata]|uniref:MADF domain-containing protein n=1 Tax=Phyllotreta striolata TaxID=444603 RepID=A0A9N9TMD2_PHYSR|nr:unnamed protein product [Phyllotreta striolata]